MKKTATRVWLLGAGPGNAGLLTRRGEQVLKSAEIVIYDALVGDEILGLIPEEAQQIYVGKRSGRHEKSQEEIGELLVQAAARKERVVRLKGGDPFIFGRGSEEAALLKARGVPFEVIPGVTSASAVPSYCGIPLTHRELSSSFHVITGHKKDGQPVPMNYKAMAEIGGTLVFLMSVRSAERICAGLLEAGMDPDTPAAFLQEGTTAGQKKVLSDLAHVAEAGKAAEVKPPAILVIGAVCGLEAQCAWAEKLPLFGKKVLVTRPGERAHRMAEKLRAAGAEAVELPAVKICPADDDAQLDRAIEHLGVKGCYHWLAFTSPAGAELFLRKLRDRRMDVRLLSGIQIAVIGRGTAEVLEQSGIYPDYIPGRFYAAALGEGLATVMKEGERLLILRAREGSEDLLTPLKEKGILYEDLTLYETSYLPDHPQARRAKERLEEKAVDFVTFTSKSTVEGFMRQVQPDQEACSGFTAVCIGEKTMEAAQKYGLRCLCPPVPSIDSMVECMTEYTARERSS